MHETVAKWLFEQFSELAPLGARVIEFGAQDINGAARNCVPPIYKTWFGVDRVDGNGVDQVGDCAAEVYLPGTWDVAVCTNVLEHDYRWRSIVVNLIRHVKDGGVVLIQCPGPGFTPHSGRVEGPLQEGEYYANVSAAEIEHIVRAIRPPVTILQAEQGGWCGTLDSFVVLRK